MDALLMQVPNSFAGWIVSLILVAGGVSYVFRSIRSRDMKELREFNQDLLQKTDFLEKKIENLERSNKELTDKVGILEKHNKTLEDLVITALKQWFFENPDLAKDLQAKIIKK